MLSTVRWSGGVLLVLIICLYWYTIARQSDAANLRARSGRTEDEVKKLHLLVQGLSEQVSAHSGRTEDEVKKLHLLVRGLSEQGNSKNAVGQASSLLSPIAERQNGSAEKRSILASLAAPLGPSCPSIGSYLDPHLLPVRKTRPLIDGVDKIYVMHSPGNSGYRRKSIEAQLDKHLKGWRGTEYVSFVEALEFSYLKERKDTLLKCIWPEKSPLLEYDFRLMSLTLKHVLSYYDMLKRNYSTSLVLEDDALFSDGFDQNVVRVLHALPEGWATLFFDPRHKACTRQKSIKNLFCEIPDQRKASSGSFAYLVSEYGASRLLEDIPFPGKKSDGIDFCSDQRMDRIKKRLKTLFKSYVMLPSVQYIVHSPLNGTTLHWHHGSYSGGGAV